MSVHDEQNFDDEHFDEVDAVRRFPSEDKWLDLPAPDLSGGEHSSASAAPTDSEADATKAASFADRVMRAREQERALDARLLDLDKALPNELLQQFTAPTPSESFVDDTVATVMNDRRNRWQQMLARHVAPTPSAVFVARTIEALRDDQAVRGGDTQHDRSAAARSGAETAASPTPHSRGSMQSNRSNWPVFSLAAAAAAAMFWLLLTDVAPLPLEVRLAGQASPAAAYAEATTPMSAILARVAHDEEPFVVFDTPADGLWLVSTKGELR